METSSDLLIYGLLSAKGAKFKLPLPNIAPKTRVRDLKLRILNERRFPVECQTLFLCREQKLHLLKDEEIIPSIGNSTLHLYVTKSAQQKNLEKTRQSDFDDWLDRIKQLHLTGNYGEKLPHVQAKAQTLQAETLPKAQPLPAATAYKKSEVAPTIAPAVVEVPLGKPQLMKSYNAVADYCHMCNRQGTRRVASHYCHTCDEYSCVLCSDCAARHPQVHAIEQIQYKNIATPKALPATKVDSTLDEVLHQTIHEVEADPGSWACDACTTINKKDAKVCEVCEKANPNAQPDPPPPAIPEAGWQCDTCTLFNLPYRPSCAMCAADRPPGYKIPAGYVPVEEERKFADGALASQVAFEQALEEEKRQQAEERERNRKLLIGADESNLIANDESFECSICFTECEAGEGVKLRDCLHTFCKDCLKGHVESSENPEVRCPFMDENYQCDEAMQEREIREIAPEFYPKLLEKSLQVAESQAADSFHCKTLNCPGWCTFDEDVNFFQCPVCNARNCLTCQAIHDNQDCKEYQDELKRKAEIDDEAKKTQEELERLLREHLAMHCPKCKIIIMKKTGCDWIQCSVCKTEICWVTRQARWGPKGRGDTSGGCKCNVDGRPCAPNCGNCH